MSLNKQDVEKIAHLARIALSEQDVPLYARNLSNILEFVEQMNAADIGGIEPMAHPQDLSARLRPDLVMESDQREKLQKIAPRVEAGLYLVPKVIE
jgi:aspartyl-tRNA(Asn)/glutamyl-tRNA(Gln) amidotransferase subunit C